MHLQKSTSAEETLLAKAAFESYAKNRGVAMLACHANNGTFQANVWVKSCRDSGQGLTFAGVNAHHQNGHV